jgi:hypothetical protein
MWRIARKRCVGGADGRLGAREDSMRWYSVVRHMVYHFKNRVVM